MGASALLWEGAGVWAKAVPAQTTKRKAVRISIILYSNLPTQYTTYPIGRSPGVPLPRLVHRAVLPTLRTPPAERPVATLRGGRSRFIGPTHDHLRQKVSRLGTVPLIENRT